MPNVECFYAVHFALMTMKQTVVEQAPILPGLIVTLISHLQILLLCM